MKSRNATNAFAALGHETRLALYRRLVKAGPAGVGAGDLADVLGISPSSLTFHVAQLERADLVASRREGRRIIYTADFGAMGEVVDFLTQECCGGHPEVCGVLKKSRSRTS
ncbi:MAG: metalloregulator ArsR/SmtB family transcription factor [Proteobacteria bacterium]|nr:metalloregulator ArsR/SmtB family transcription factor [Pseudomonadota bacterium]